jgi:small subunit ribosomal protein S21
VAHQRTYFPEERSGICVVRRDGENDEELIKRFRKKFSKSGLAKELRERVAFEKPSDKRRRRKAQSIRNIEKEEEKLKQLKEKARKAKAKRQRREWKYDKSSRRQSGSSSYEKGNDGWRDSDSE